MIDDPHGPLYSVVCTDTNPDGTWQTEFLEHTWLRSGMPGELVRLVAAPNGEALPRHQTARVVRTSAKNTHHCFDGDYVPMNRLHSLNEWLERERPVGTILILDCDFAFRSSINRRAEPGQPIGQEWQDFAMVGDLAEVAEALRPGVVSRVQRVTWPLLIHTSDLRRIIQRWVDVTAHIRRSLQLWESDMFALTIVLAEYGLSCELETLGAWMPWPDDVVGNAPIVHYCQPVLDRNGGLLWYKQDYAPWTPLPFDPNDAELSYCRELLTMLQRFAALKSAASEVLRG